MIAPARPAALAGIGFVVGGLFLIAVVVGGGELGAPILAAVAAGLVVGGGFALWLAFRTSGEGGSVSGGDDDTARAILSAIPEGVVVMRDGVIVAANRRLCAMLGCTRDDLVGTTEPYPFWPPEHRHAIERWQEIVRDRGSFETELAFRSSAGERIPVLAAGSVIRDSLGRPRTQVIAVRDITERRRVEDQLAELASRDPLTALLNEWGFQERLAEEVARAQAGDRTASVALIELDGVHDRRELARVLERFREIVRAGEQIARTTENELAWVLPETDAAGAVAAVERARTSLAGEVTLTAGVCDLSEAADAVTLYALADRALAAARSRGGDVTVAYTPSVVSALR